MSARIIRGDARDLPLPDGCADLIVTSPPYFGLRSYTDNDEHYPGQIGSEATPQEYVAALVACTREWVRVLKPEGSLFVILGDKYATRYSSLRGGGRAGLNGDDDTRGRSGQNHTGVGEKCLLGLPWRYALACTDQLGLILRAEIIWAKPNGLPESVTDRVRRGHEQVFHFTRQPRYYTAVDEIRTPHQGKPQRRLTPHVAGALGNSARDGGWSGLERSTVEHDGHPLGALPGSVWDIPSQPLTVPPALGVDHFAAFPMELPRRCILGWSPPGVCTACGQGRRPVSEVTERPYAHGRPGRGLDSMIAADRARGGQQDFAASALRTAPVRSINGYACACPEPGAPTRPALVLDPFGGTGSTALVADVLGRTGISIDRSADYCRLARWRTTDPAEHARAMQVPKPPPVPEGQAAFDWAVSS
jgi:DNA modification methylase